MAGAYDLLACVKGDSITDIAMFVAKRLSTLDGVLSTNTRFQLKTYKKSGISFYDDEEEQDKRSIVL
jgi:DNA-binding Lrp family transcriptional regulator